jgi:predicted dienelactone hydrolase
MKGIFTIINLLVITSLFAQHQVGHYQITFQDPDRGNRAIQTEIYYPSTIAGDNTPVAPGLYPVIVFGHGFVMAWDAYQNLWDEFVPRGYIMVFPRTEGSAFSTNHQEFGWDLQFLVNELQVEGTNSSSPINGAVANNTALMGHSMGGGASFLAADSLCTNGNTQLKTLIGLAPAESSTNGVSSINSALSVTVPSLILSGSQDGVTPPIDHHIPMYNGLASNCKTILSVTGGAHCYFANTNTACDFGELTSSTGISITRAEQHQVTFDFVNNWLDYTLKDDCSAFHDFQDSVSNSSRVVPTQSCTTNPTPSISNNSGTLSSSITGSSYQWFLNGNAISGATSNTYNALQNGDYTVEVSFNTGCPTLSNIYSYSDGTSGLSSLNYAPINIRPNPTSGKISINEITEVQLYSIAGQFIKNFGMTNEIDITLLPKGIYFLKISNSFHKVVKE